jgi:CCR4-NOT transcriptional regulation complex NOT5 subunit
MISINPSTLGTNTSTVINIKPSTLGTNTSTVININPSTLDTNTSTVIGIKPSTLGTNYNPSTLGINTSTVININPRNTRHQHANSDRHQPFNTWHQDARCRVIGIDTSTHNSSALRGNTSTMINIKPPHSASIPKHSPPTRQQGLASTLQHAPRSGSRHDEHCAKSTAFGSAAEKSFGIATKGTVFVQPRSEKFGIDLAPTRQQ